MHNLPHEFIRIGKKIKIKIKRSKRLCRNYEKCIKKILIGNHSYNENTAVEFVLVVPCQAGSEE